jgi:rare lipoprotein A (peptidoglycan hydrolase)
LVKKIAVMVFFMTVFCFWGSIKGGQADEISLPVCRNLEEIEYFMETKPYIPIKNPANFWSKTEHLLGKASWYGPGFHGRRTASGEIFDENAMTAAHRELPFGTQILVTNLRNGKSTIVTINDRGPYIEGRHVDLSKAAAMDLDMIDAGVVNVTMKILK